MHKCFFPEGGLRQEQLPPAVANTVVGVKHLFNMQQQRANSLHQHLQLPKTASDQNTAEVLIALSQNLALSPEEWLSHQPEQFLSVKV